MHAQRPAPGRDVGDDLVQAVLVGQEGGELVDHDEQARQRAGRGGIVDVTGPARPEGALAVAHLRPQAVEGPVGALPVEVGDEAHGVRQDQQGVERGAALEVDEEHGDLLGRVRGGQRRDPGDEQLALAAAGRSRDDRVRAVRDQVDGDGSRVPDADDGRQAAGRGRARARLRRQVGEGHPRGEGCPGRREAAPAGELGELGGQALRLVERDELEAHAARAGEPRRPGLGPVIVVEGARGGRRVRDARLGALRGGARGEDARGPGGPDVQHRAARGGERLDPVGGGQHDLPRGDPHADAGGSRLGCADGVGLRLAQVRGVRESREPVPRGAGRTRHDAEVVGRERVHELHDDAAEHGRDHGGRAAEPEAPGRGDEDGGVGDPADGIRPPERGMLRRRDPAG
ncbi:hypothetical protein CMsap09_12220 [Clavibacter michiganensis]|uniref:Uncharacterized protein n=1 Tax=Clavibacter michiganensis TaxID=28447 RepID=A0A251XW56_9MICO|nr:hypothetical protein CMsap09_12220 [Clavibacter michiganensis]